MHDLSADIPPQVHHKHLCSWKVRAAVYLWEEQKKAGSEEAS